MLTHVNDKFNGNNLAADKTDRKTYSMYRYTRQIDRLTVCEQQSKLKF